VRELLQLGVSEVYLALDGDKAGQEAAVKIGHLFQKKGVEVKVVPLGEGKDPDSLLTERDVEYFSNLLTQSIDYLTFLFSHLSRGVDLSSPSQKNEIVSKIVSQINAWEMPVMIHESLKKLAEISKVPEAALGIGQISLPDLFIKRSDSIKLQGIDPHQILEGDFIRWLLFAAPQSPKISQIAKENITPSHLRVSAAQRLYSAFLQALEEGKASDLLTLGSALEGEEEQKWLTETLQRKSNLQKAEEGFKETARKILLRSWMEEREAIRTRLQNGAFSDEEALELARQFDEIKKRVPELK